MLIDSGKVLKAEMTEWFKLSISGRSQWAAGEIAE